MKLLASLTLAFAIVSSLPAQTPPVAFEVASVRPHRGDVFRSGFPPSGSLIGLEGYTIFGLVLDAYNLNNYQLTFGSVTRPDDIYDTMYDITARAPGNGVPSAEETRAMLRTLLAERFALKVHRELKDMSIYALVTGKSGGRLKASSSESPCSAHEKLAPDGRNNRGAFAGCTLDVLADHLGHWVEGRPVVDRTRLTGAYDFQLVAAPEYRGRGQFNPADISVFSAVGEIGLKLVPLKAQIEILAVDRVETPSEND